MYTLTRGRNGRISLEQTRSVSEGLVAKLEEQAAEVENGDPSPDDEGDEPAENGVQEEDEEEQGEEESEDDV